MIQLFINNLECVLPDDFSFPMIEENSEITTAGEYSLNITLSLLEPKNVKALKFINRLNKSDIQKKADSYLIDDGEVKYGTITNIKNTNTELIFQWLSGNSELTYILANDKRKIWELDWGTELEIDYERALTSLNYPGYGLFDNFQNNFVCTPIKAGTQIFNNYSLDYVAGEMDINGITGAIAMQPYMLYYVNKLPQLLGYTLKNNCLMTDPIALKKYFVNPIASLNYSDVLPDMTISEFKSEIEKLYNVEFIVDNKDKTISINSAIAEIANKSLIHLNNVLDAYERDFSSKTDTTFQALKSIVYTHDSSKFFAYHNISADVLAQFTIYEYANFSDLLTGLLTLTLEEKLGFTMFKNNATGHYYLFSNNSADSMAHAPYFNYFISGNGLILINKFRDYIETSTDEVLELKISPAAFTAIKKTGSWDGEVGLTDIWIQMPVSSRVPEVEVVQDKFETIENGVKLLPRINFIEVALYTGRIVPFENSVTERASFTYPYSHIDKLPEFFTYVIDQAITDRWVNNHFSIAATETLRLYGDDGIKKTYHDENLVDVDKEYVFIMPQIPDIKAKNLFLYENQRYLPIKFERQKSNKPSLVTGYFYRML